MEQQETNKKDKTDAGDYHSTQQEAVAAFSLYNLGNEIATLNYLNKNLNLLWACFFLQL